MWNNLVLGLGSQKGKGRTLTIVRKEYLSKKVKMAPYNSMFLSTLGKWRNIKLIECKEWST